MANEIILTSDVQGVRDFRALRAQFGSVPGNNPDVTPRATNGPIVVELLEDFAADDFDPQDVNQVKLVGSTWESIRKIKVRNISGQAISAGTSESPVRLVAKHCGSLGHVIENSGAGSGGSGSDGDCCCCQSIEFADTILTDGIKTARKRIPCAQIGPIKYKYEWGTLTITLPEPAEMVLEREDVEPESDNFIWEMTEDVFTAVYNDGTDASDDLVEPSGTVQFNHTLPVDEYDCGCPQMRMRIEWDVDEPIPDAGSGE